ncbi:SDR family oxidoreductase [Pigmentiphaga aceris]|uniref:SDR family oxidoreductase n=1 Tax=Pigmentiphaga aceris TaxID=1940612 RepID=A0A5C0AXL1_9BURK|nr:NAD-dependent epimerase/dehydratase family protein [Pigmentiphaga aceris]QEI07189.1 SDR family oxidoreductase [Pigmentiphaga aceris]
MRVLITGADGFIAKTLRVKLVERPDIEVLSYTRDADPATLPALVAQADAVIHLAGVNQSSDAEGFRVGNADFTRQLAGLLYADGRALPVVMASAEQTRVQTPYARSKWEAEQVLKAYATATGAQVYIYRLPTVFGKWAAPDRHSTIATWCRDIATGQAVTIDDPAERLRLVYVDDVADEFIRVLQDRPVLEHPRVPVEYTSTAGEVLNALRAFRASRATLATPDVGTGLLRALHATYLSYLPPDEFSYRIPRHADARGAFVEVLKTPHAGQFSFFTAGPGVTRGGHYHHSKTEKFLVLRGRAHFRFRQIVSGLTHQIHTDGDTPEVVETVPGWTHDITNVGDQELIVMLWANEVFDRDRPDTIAAAL